MDKDKDHSILLTHHIKPDYGFYVQGDDRLFVSVHASVASLVVRFSGYFLAYDGTVKEYAIEVAPTSDRVATTATQFFGEGFILSCSVHLLTGNANRGQCYVRVRIQRGTGATALPIARLLQGYLSDDYAPSFPYGKMEGPLEGQGMLRSVTGTDPAANTEISETVPTGARWKLYLMEITLVTDGTAANRLPTIIIDDGTTRLAQAQTAVSLTASLTWRMSVANWGFAGVSVGANLHFPVPLPLLLPAGARITTSTASLQVTDNYGAPQMLVEEWIEA